MLQLNIVIISSIETVDDKSITVANCIPELN